MDLLRELSRIGFTDGELRFADDEACAVSGRKPGEHHRHPHRRRGAAYEADRPWTERA